MSNSRVEVLWTEDGWKVDLKKFGWKNTMEEAEAIALSLQMCYTPEFNTCESKKWLQAQ